MNGVELQIWEQRERPRRKPLCGHCLTNPAELIVAEDFDCWLGSAEKGDLICGECAVKIGLVDS